MSLLGLAFRNIKGSAFRSWVILLCVLVVSGFSLAITLIARGAENSLYVGMERLGADIVVVPEGVETQVESALLMGKPTSVWMPEGNLQKIANVPGVAVVSPQLFLTSLKGASCCAVEELFLVAYDPQSDFTVRPWLESHLGKGLGTGEVIGGTHIFVPDGDDFIQMYGYFLTLRGNLEPTGTGLDQALFMTFDTAREVARISRSRAERPLEIASGSISAVMVKVQPGMDRREVALQIMQEVPGVTPIESPNLFQSFRKQLNGLLRGVLAVLAIIWSLSVVLIGLVFSMAANERRREIAVLRALGATRHFVFRSILTEAALLALVGGALGILLAGTGTRLFIELIITSLEIPFLFPALPEFLSLLGGALVVALIVVTMAALMPAFRISRQDPAVAMRE